MRTTGKNIKNSIELKSILILLFCTTLRKNLFHSTIKYMLCNKKLRSHVYSGNLPLIMIDLSHIDLAADKGKEYYPDRRRYRKL